MKPKLKVDVNRNPTKKGIKIQFELPSIPNNDKKNEIIQQLQTKLNKGLVDYGLTVNLDTDVPFDNVIGFLIPIGQFKLIIKNILIPDNSDINDFGPNPFDNPEIQNSDEET